MILTYQAVRHYTKSGRKSSQWDIIDSFGNHISRVVSRIQAFFLVDTMNKNLLTVQAAGAESQPVYEIKPISIQFDSNSSGVLNTNQPDPTPTPAQDSTPAPQPTPESDATTDDPTANPVKKGSSSFANLFSGLKYEHEQLELSFDGYYDVVRTNRKVLDYREYFSTNK